MTIKPKTRLVPDIIEEVNKDLLDASIITKKRTLEIEKRLSNDSNMLETPNE